jgi:hypothetical protein
MKSKFNINNLFINLSGFLVGIFMVSIAFFRASIFFSNYLIVAFGFNIFFALGFLISFYFGFKIFNLKGIWGVLFLCFIECLIFLKTTFEVKNQSKFLFSFPGKSFIYSNMANTLQFDDTICDYDDIIGYKYKPSVNASFSQWEFKVKNLTTNSFGLRDDETSLVNPKIISLGDSFCTGWGVEQDQTYTDIIEKRLNIKSLNAGMSSYGTIREGLMLKSLDRDSLKLVILQYCLNDFKENKTWADSLASGATFHPSYNENEYKKRVIQNSVLRAYFPFRYIFEIIKEGAKEKFNLKSPENNFGDKKTLLQQRAYFVKSIKLIRKFYDGPILVISLSNSPQRLDPLIIENARLETQNNQMKDITFLNLQKVIGPNDHYFFDGHLTKFGHEKVARSIVKYIKEKSI